MQIVERIQLERRAQNLTIHVGYIVTKLVSLFLMFVTTSPELAHILLVGGTENLRN